ncbi:MAG: hypothetical protein ACRDJU_01235 [Actinomycetota bacterium]
MERAEYETEAEETEQFWRAAGCRWRGLLAAAVVAISAAGALLVIRLVGPGVPVTAPGSPPIEQVKATLPPGLGSLQLFGRSGWAVTAATCQLLATADGGLTCRNVIPSGVGTAAAAFCTSLFLDARHAWVVAYGQGSGSGVASHRDGGATWTATIVPGTGVVGELLNSVAPVPAGRQPRVFLCTSDRGIRGEMYTEFKTVLLHGA